MDVTSRRTVLRGAGSGLAILSLPACSAPERLSAVPAGRSTEATVLGVPNERFFPAHGVGPLEAEFAAAFERQMRSLGLKSIDSLPTWQLLAISGGGENGAFGAGLLCGWSDQGTRPTFNLVTGVSTGALSAPFAFLGSAYDGALRAVYTEVSPERVLQKRNLLAALLGDAMADNAPLFELIAHHVDDALLAAVAQAYDSGRLLLVVTTDLDAQQPVIWNIGAMAKSAHPRAADTIRRVLLASAAIPAAFPPTMIDVTVDGVMHQEMHVDGGAYAQAFLYPTALTAQRRERMRGSQKVLSANAYIIRNGRLHPEWGRVERRTLGIAGRAIATMIIASGYNDIVRIYDNARRDGFGYNLAYIEPDFREVLSTPFDTAYMRSLFAYAYDKAVGGYPWAKKPPIAG